MTTCILPCFLSRLRKLDERFNADGIVLVGDRGMLKAPQIDQLQSDPFNFNYITAIAKPQIETLLHKGCLQMELFESELAEVVDGAVRYILRCNPTRRKEVQGIRRSKLDAGVTVPSILPHHNVKVATRKKLVNERLTL